MVSATQGRVAENDREKRSINQISLQAAAGHRANGLAIVLTNRHQRPRRAGRGTPRMHNPEIAPLSPTLPHSISVDRTS